MCKENKACGKIHPSSLPFYQLCDNGTPISEDLMKFFAAWVDLYYCHYVAKDIPAPKPLAPRAMQSKPIILKHVKPLNSKFRVKDVDEAVLA